MKAMIFICGVFVGACASSLGWSLWLHSEAGLSNTGWAFVFGGVALGMIAAAMTD